jgi:hypothetical protein
MIGRRRLKFPLAEATKIERDVGRQMRVMSRVKSTLKQAPENHSHSCSAQRIVEFGRLGHANDDDTSSVAALSGGGLGDVG